MPEAHTPATLKRLLVFETDGLTPRLRCCNHGDSLFHAEIADRTAGGMQTNLQAKLRVSFLLRILTFFEFLIRGHRSPIRA